MRAQRVWLMVLMFLDSELKMTINTIEEDDTRLMPACYYVDICDAINKLGHWVDC